MGTEQYQHLVLFGGSDVIAKVQHPFIAGNLGQLEGVVDVADEVGYTRIIHSIGRRYYYRTVQNVIEVGLLYPDAQDHVSRQLPGSGYRPAGGQLGQLTVLGGLPVATEA